MTYTTASCFNKLCLLHCTTGKSLKSIVAAKCVEGYARTPVKELKSRRHLTLCFGRAKGWWARAGTVGSCGPTARKSLPRWHRMWHLYSLPKCIPLLRTETRLGRVNGRAKEALHSVLKFEIINHKWLFRIPASVKQNIIQGSAFCSIHMHNVD